MENDIKNDIATIEGKLNKKDPTQVLIKMSIPIEVYVRLNLEHQVHTLLKELKLVDKL